MKKLIFISIVLIFWGNSIHAQVTIGANIAPASSAVLDLQGAGTKGMLLPRISDTAHVLMPTSGLVVYDSVHQKIYCYLANRWQEISRNSNSNWKLAGNAGIDSLSNFIGTRDSVGFVVKTNNQKAIVFGANGKIGMGSANPQATLAVNAKSGSEVFNNGFESAVISPFTTFGDANWAITGSVRNSGLFSAVSGTITDGEYTVLSLDSNVPANSEISFACKVSTESFYDELSFYIDGIYIDSWSGIGAFQTVKFPVTAGSHTFEWEYYKDGFCCTEGQDKVWVDDIKIYALAQPVLSILNAARTNLMQVDSSGRLTLGTTTSTARLNISGSIKITNSESGTGKVLSTDSLGLASWQTVAPADTSNWSRAGDSATNLLVNFLGTKDTSGLRIGVNGVPIFAVDALRDSNAVFLKGFNNRIGLMYNNVFTNYPIKIDAYNNCFGNGSFNLKEGLYNTAIGSFAMHTTDTAYANTVVGGVAGPYNIAGQENSSGNIFLGFGGGGSAFGRGNDDKFDINNGLRELGIYGTWPLISGDIPTGNVGFGTLFPLSTLTIDPIDPNVGGDRSGLKFTRLNGTSATSSGMGLLVIGNGDLCNSGYSWSAEGKRAGINVIASQATMHVLATAGNNGMGLTIPSEASFGMRFFNTSFSNSNPLFSIKTLNSGITKIGTDQNTDLRFYTNGISNLKLVIKADGKIGISTVTPAATLDVQGGIAMAIKKINANYNVQANDYTIINTGSDISLTLPAAGTINNGQIYKVVNAGTGNITTSPVKKDAGPAISLLLFPESRISVQSDGVNWYQTF